MENGLGASGADITISLIDMYNTAHMKPDSTNRGTVPSPMYVDFSSYRAITWYDFSF